MKRKESIKHGQREQQHKDFERADASIARGALTRCADAPSRLELAGNMSKAAAAAAEEEGLGGGAFGAIGKAVQGLGDLADFIEEDEKEPAENEEGEEADGCSPSKRKGQGDGGPLPKKKSNNQNWFDAGIRNKAISTHEIWMKTQRATLEEICDLLKEAMAKVTSDISASVEKEQKFAENRIRAIKLCLARDPEPSTFFLLSFPTRRRRSVLEFASKRFRELQYILI